MAKKFPLPYKTAYLEISYGERPPYTENATRDGVTVKRTLVCSWSDAVNFPTAMLGTVKKRDVPPGGIPPNQTPLERVLPQAHPHGSKNLFAVACDLKNGHGAFVQDIGANLIFFKDMVNDLEGLAEFEVTYQQLPFDVLNDTDAASSGGELSRFVSRDKDTSPEVYQLPGSSFTFDRPDLGGREKLLPEPVAMRRLVSQLRYTWHWVPEPVNPNIDDMLGKVNAAPFDGVSANPKWERERLMFQDYEVSERKWTPDGKAVRDITFIFGLRADSGWNKLYRQDLADYDRIRRRRMRALRIVNNQEVPVWESTTEGPHLQGDFGSLFLP